MNYNVEWMLRLRRKRECNTLRKPFIYSETPQCHGTYACSSEVCIPSSMGWCPGRSATGSSSTDAASRSWTRHRRRRMAQSCALWCEAGGGSRRRNQYGPSLAALAREFRHFLLAPARPPASGLQSISESRGPALPLPKPHRVLKRKSIVNHCGNVCVIMRTINYRRQPKIQPHHILSLYMYLVLKVIFGLKQI